MQWLKKNTWWVGLVLAILIALFPKEFGAIGTIIKGVVIDYWLQISVIIIIFLLLIVCRLLIKIKQAS